MKKGIATAMASGDASPAADGQLKADASNKRRLMTWNRAIMCSAVVALAVALIMRFWGPQDLGLGEKKLSLDDIRARAAAAPCSNSHDNERCHKMTLKGSCDTHPGWMGLSCAASCGTCDLLDSKIRCDPVRIGYDASDAWAPGSLSKLFVGLVDRYPEYEIEVLSDPSTFGPWILRFQNFLSDEEIDALITMSMGKYKRSSDRGEIDERGVVGSKISNRRTSENAWCKEKCEMNPLIKGVMNRIEKITGVPQGNFENFQLLRYQVNQEYKRHHDTNEDDNERLAGPRILTFFLYLSDSEGGGTQFTDLDPTLTVTPKKGTAILWPSVLDEDPTKKDNRTFHAALPVTGGVKYAANTWIRLRNFRIPNLHGCAGGIN